MSDAIKISARNLSLFYGKAQALRSITIDVPAHKIIGIIGPAGSGKTAFLRCINRLNDLNPACRIEGRLLLDGADVYGAEQDIVDLRKRVGMVFALPVPLPMSIFDNITYGLRLGRGRARARFDEVV